MGYPTIESVAIAARNRITVGYPSDVTETTLLARPASVGAMLLNQVKESSSKEAFRYIEGDRWVSLSWLQTAAAVLTTRVSSSCRPDLITVAISDARSRLTISRTCSREGEAAFR